MNGVILIDKPAGWTSHDVVNRMRRILGQRSIGHLGTLDPLATGVLPLVVGNLTRLAQFYTTSEKSYEGVIRFGFATDTYDADGDPLANPVNDNPINHPRPATLSLEQLQELAAGFLGLTEQIPPPFSAKKIHGVPAYKLARKRQEVILKPVQVEIKEFVILSVEGDRARFRARVASGTYMRSVAHEMGQLLGCGAHLESLRRTAVAEFDISQAHTLEEIEVCHSERVPAERVRANASASRRIPGPISPFNNNYGLPNADSGAIETNAIDDFFVHPRQLLPQFPCVAADEPTVARIRSGRPINLPELSRARHVKVFQGQRDLIAIATRVAGTLFHPKIVFVTEQPVPVAKGN
jgi:tRNA pseudouridine55 synthase